MEHRTRIRRRRGVVALAAALACAVTTGFATAAGPATDVSVALDRVVVSDLVGFGAQFNQHVYADLSGPPPGLADLEQKVVALGPRYVRIFFNSTEWAFPDRMASFVRTVQLAQRAEATIEIDWQGGSYAFTMASLGRFADVLADLIEHEGITSGFWVSLYNEPNSGGLTLPQFEATYRQLDAELRARGVRDRIRFLGGGILASTNQGTWYWYMAQRMGDLLDAWAPHVYWDFWDTPKIERRLTEVRAIVDAIPENLRKPIYVTEFGVRGLRTFDGELTFEPGYFPDGTPVAVTTAGAFEEAWFMLRALQLGYPAVSKWDLYDATYDNGTQDYSTIGPGADGWPLRPSYNLLRLLTLVTRPVGGRVVAVDTVAGGDPGKLVTAYVSPAGNITVLGLDTAGATIGSTAADPVSYRIGGLPPNTLFRLIVWNADGRGTNREIGFLPTGADGTIAISVPLHGVFALTTAPLGELPW